VQQPPVPTGSAERSILVLALALVVLASPLRALWMQDGAHWLLPFGVWAALIALGGFALRTPRP
jgi:hypothetical protein